MRKLLLDVCQDIDVRLYPPPYGDIALKAISDFLGFSESEISVGNGADEVLELLMKVFVKKDSKVLVVEPTFPMYTYFTRLYGGRKVTVLLRPNFELDIDAILEKIDIEKPLYSSFVPQTTQPATNSKKETSKKSCRSLTALSLSMKPTLTSPNTRLSTG